MIIRTNQTVLIQTHAQDQEDLITDQLTKETSHTIKVAEEANHHLVQDQLQNMEVPQIKKETQQNQGITKVFHHLRI